MGMFNYVIVPTEFRICPYCKGNLREFQTKDGDCLSLTEVNYTTVTNFYTNCDYCFKWVEYKLVLKTDGKPSRQVWDFVLVGDLGERVSRASNPKQRKTNE